MYTQMSIIIVSQRSDSRVFLMNLVVDIFLEQDGPSLNGGRFCVVKSGKVTK